MSSSLLGPWAHIADTLSRSRLCRTRLRTPGNPSVHGPVASSRFRDCSLFTDHCSLFKFRPRPAQPRVWILRNGFPVTIGTIPDRLQGGSSIKTLLSGLVLTLWLTTSSLLALTERTSTAQTGWWWFYGVSENRINQEVKKNGARLIDIEVVKASPPRFNVSMVKNAGVHKKVWWWCYGLTENKVNALAKEKKARILDVERYRVGGKTRFAVVLIANKGSDNRGWWWYYGASAGKVKSLISKNKAKLIDLDVESTSPLRFTVVMVKESGRSWWYYGKSEKELNALLGSKKAKLIDIERYRSGGKTLFAAVMRPHKGYWWWYHGLSTGQVTHLYRRNGARLVDIESSGSKYSVVMVDNGIKKSGKAVPGLKPIEDRVIATMKQYSIPGAALAVVKSGRLVLSRGYGYADIGKRKVVQPNNLFRIASISKPVTRSAIFKLRDQKKLMLGDRVFIKHLTNLKPSKLADKRYNDVTIQHLMDHKGGWDITKLGFDPQFYSNQIASKMRTPKPTSGVNIIRYMLKYRKLNTKPGTANAYSNFGYNILGRVIAKASGMSYDAYLRKRILAPAGISRMAIGKTKKSGTAKGEVLYYMPPFASKITSVLPSGPKQVSAPYGGFYVKSFDAHGG